MKYEHYGLVKIVPITGSKLITAIAITEICSNANYSKSNLVVSEADSDYELANG